MKPIEETDFFKGLLIDAQHDIKTNKTIWSGETRFRSETITFDDEDVTLDQMKPMLAEQMRNHILNYIGVTDEDIHAIRD